MLTRQATGTVPFSAVAVEPYERKDGTIIEPHGLWCWNVASPPSQSRAGSTSSANDGGRRKSSANSGRKGSQVAPARLVQVLPVAGDLPP
jgi:hypothetical protein